MAIASIELPKIDREEARFILRHNPELAVDKFLSEMYYYSTEVPTQKFIEKAFEYFRRLEAIKRERPLGQN